MNLNRYIIENSLEIENRIEVSKKGFYDSNSNINEDNKLNLPYKRNRVFKIRNRGWICWNCKNINFPFRKECSICLITNEFSDKLKDLYLSIKNMNI